MSLDFAARLGVFRNHLAKAEEHLEVLGLAREIEGLRAAAGHEEFRIAVLGRFKNGKSTLVNALLGSALSPSDLLPSTSRLIEFRGGPALTFRKVAHDRGQDSSEEEFREDAGSAAHGGSEGPAVTWRVTVPTPWLEAGLVLVDTPGTDEDAGRLSIANEELERADAALLVMRASQAGGLRELEDLAALSQRVALLLVVLNRADEVSVEQWPRVVEHLRRVVADRGIPPEHVLLLSSRDALAGTPAAVTQLEAVRRAISSVLLQSVAGARLESLCRRTEAHLSTLLPRIEQAVSATAAERQEKRQGADDAAAALGQWEKYRKRVETIFAEGAQRASSACGRAMKQEWRPLVERVCSQRERWHCEQNPLTSPKAYAEGIAAAAQASLERKVKTFIKTGIQPLITAESANTTKEVEGEIQELLAAASSTGLGTADHLKGALLQEAVSDAFGKAVTDAASDGATGAAVAIVVSAVVGYIVADVVLYYVLALVAGFLNPAILVGAVVVGGVMYFVKGRDWLETKTKANIADKLEEALGKSTVTKRVVASVESATTDSFEKLAAGYLRQLDSMVERARRQRERSAEDASSADTAHRGSMDRAEGAKVALQSMLEALRLDARGLERDRSGS